MKKYKWIQYGASIHISGIDNPIYVPYSDWRIIDWIITRFKPKRYTTMRQIIEQKKSEADDYLDSLIMKPIGENE